MPERPLRAPAARLHHRHPGQRPARPHAGDGRGAPRPQDAHLLRGQRPRLRRRDAHHQGAPSTTRRRCTLRRRGRRGDLRIRERADRDRAASGASRAGAAVAPRRWRSRRTGWSRSSSSPRSASRLRRFGAVDDAPDARRRAARIRRTRHPEDAPAGLRRQGPGERARRAGMRRVPGSGRRPTGGAREAHRASRARSRRWSCAGQTARTRLLRLPRQHPRERHPAPLGRAGGPARSRSRAAPATSPQPSPTRSTMSACWRWRCSISGRTRPRPSA